jgi:hypothetical protein
MEQWTFTTDTGMAAAFGTLGMPVKIYKGMLEKEAVVRVRFGIGLRDVDGKYKTKLIQSHHRSGRLQHEKPDHPFLVILRTFANRDAILNFCNQGQFIRLCPMVGGETFTYRKSDTGLPGVTRGDAVIRTGDLKLVSALATIGLPILAIEGDRHRRVFTVQAANSRHNGPELMMAWRHKPESIPWENPFAQAMRGLHNRERLLDAIHRSDMKVTLIGINERHAILTADKDGNLSNKALQTASDFLE